MSNSPTLAKHNVFMDDVTVEVWVDCPWAEMLLVGNKGVTEADTHPRYFRNNLKKLAGLWKVFTVVPPRDLPHVTSLLGNRIKVGKYLPMGNVHVFNLRRPPIHCISAGTGTMAEKSKKPNIDRAMLEKQNVTFYDIEEVKLPLDVDAVGEGLLKFNIPLDRVSTKDYLNKNIYENASFEEIPDSTFSKKPFSEGQKSMMSRHLKYANHLTKEAQKLKRDGSLEDEWTALLNEWVFKVFASRGDYDKD